MNHTLKKLLVEFIGTFFLVLTVGLTALKTPEGVIPPIAIGAILMTMVYAGGYISGGQYNPAVTFGVFVRGAMSVADSALYIVAQLLAGLPPRAWRPFSKAALRLRRSPDRSPPSSSRNFSSPLRWSGSF